MKITINENTRPVPPADRQAAEAAIKAERLARKVQLIASRGAGFSILQELSAVVEESGEPLEIDFGTFVLTISKTAKV